MAVTGAIFNSLSFGGVNSADYGIYITGEAVFNAPKRAVEMVSVPGRNGSVAIDQGHWENIEVTYPAGTFGMDESEFATALSDFRNAIVSQIGYQRLTDTYHPDEYRMALYADGLEAEPTTYNKAGEFELKFNCKPQRWLANGETPVTATSGDTLTNPTPYDAGPLLAVKGYGTIGFNGYTVKVNDDVFGETELLSSISKASNFSAYYNNIIAIVGDAMSLKDLTFSFSVRSKSGADELTYTGSSVGTQTLNLSYKATRANSARYDFVFSASETALLYRTAEEYERVVTLHFTSGGHSSDLAVTMRLKNYADGHVYLYISFGTATYVRQVNVTMSFSSLVVDSTKSVLGDPSYIDCEIGEAYKLDGDTVIGLNKYIELGSDLPTLTIGANEVTYDNTITELKITPNWWKL